MVFIHDNSEESEMLELHEESDGTRRMIDILMYLINAKIKGQTLIIDEIERSLHPNLVKELVNYYTENDKNKRTQLIYSTHDENFIDLTSYRKDTIWLVDKDKSGSSKLTSLDEYDIRSDRRKIQNDYLEGRFGGIPELGSLVEVYDEVESNEGEN
jgi:AAA15 family ATPase/GTPase